MSFHPTQYEHVPYSNEDHYSPYANQVPFSNEGHYTPSTSFQPRDATGLDDPPVTPISRSSQNWHEEAVLGSSQTFHNKPKGGPDPIIHHGSVSSFPFHSFDSAAPGAAAFPSPRGRKSRGSFVNRLGDWWWWELGSVLLSLLCFVAIIVTLLIIQNESLSSWHSSISPNALISTLATVSKASLMLAVAACISQIKWLYLQHSPRPLSDIQTFDNASRGPLGALELLMRLSPKEIFTNRSGGAGWAFWASILTILALALDPFAQQILSFPLRPVASTTGHLALISTAQIYDTGNPAGVTDSQGKNVDMHMQGAVMNGLYILESPANFTCTTANCTWPSFYAVGVCSACTNVTTHLETSCDNYGRGEDCNYTLPSGLVLGSSRWTSSGGGHRTTLNVTAVVGDTGYSINITDLIVQAGIVRINKQGEYEHPEALDCSLSWCAKRYSEVVVTNGEIVTPEIRSWPLTSPDEFYNKDSKWLNPFYVADSVTDFDGPNRTFTVNANDHNTLATWLASTFFQASNQDAVAWALYLQPNISQTFENIATSMTNKIREGQNSTPVFGTAFHEETYIRVSWAWLVVPGVVVFMGAVLLAASMVLSRGGKEGLWRSSVVAPVFTRVRGWEQEGLRVGRWSEMGASARGMRGRVERSGDGGLEFVRAKGW